MMLADIKINSGLKNKTLQGEKKELQPKLKETLQSLGEKNLGKGYIEKKSGRRLKIIYVVYLRKFLVF